MKLTCGCRTWGTGKKAADMDFCRLHETAPDLLKALKDLLNVIEVDDLIAKSVSYMKQARAAVAKAEGGA